MKIKVTQIENNKITKKMYYDAIKLITEDENSFRLFNEEIDEYFISTQKVQYEWKIIEEEDKDWEKIKTNEIILREQIKSYQNKVNELIEKYKNAKEHYKENAKIAKEGKNEREEFWYNAKICITDTIIKQLKNLI